MQQGTLWESVTENNVEGPLALDQLPGHVYLPSGISFTYQGLNSHGLFVGVMGELCLPHFFLKRLFMVSLS